MAPQTVLVPLDGSAWSRQILPAVRRLLSPDAYAVTLLRVAEAPRRAFVDVPNYVPVDDMIMQLPRSAAAAVRAAHPVYRDQTEATVRAALEDELQADRYYLEAAGFAVTTVVSFGDPAAEIVEFAQRHGVALVAMATHGRTGVQWMVLGSVAEQVLRRTVVPQLLIRPALDPAAELTD